MTEEELHGTLRASPLCRGLTEIELTELLGCRFAQIKRFDKGQRLFGEEDRPVAIWMLLSGKVNVGRDTLRGHPVLLACIQTPGELFGEVYAFMEQPRYGMYAQAEAPTVVLAVDQAALLGGHTHGDALVAVLRQNLLTIFARKAYAMSRRLRVLGGQTIREKLARYLVDHQTPDGAVSARPTREELAEYLNVTRPALSRELGNMAREKILRLDGRKITILDQEMLEKSL